MRILIVEDMPLSAKMLQVQLESLGYPEPDVVHDGETAQARIAEKPYDIAFIDWVLPGMSGIKLIEAIREEPIQAGIGLIMLTARQTAEDVLEAIEAGADNYMVKPWQIDGIDRKMKEVETLVQRRRPVAALPIKAAAEAVASPSETTAEAAATPSKAAA